MRHLSFLKKYPVALVITAVVIVGSILYSQFVTPRAVAEANTAVTTAQTDTGTAADSGVSGGSYIQDNAGVLSPETERQLADYNRIWLNQYGTRIATVTVSGVEGDIKDAALSAANRIGLTGYDMILYLDIGGRACYFDCGDSLWDAYVSNHNILSTYPNQYLYDDYMAGNYDRGVLKLMDAMDSYFAACFAQVDAVYDQQAQGAYSGSSQTGGVGSILLLVILAIVLLNMIDKSRYKIWRRRYGNGVNPAVLFVPWVLWHRPGTSWWNHNIGGIGHRPPTGFGTTPRPPRPPHSSSSHRPPGMNWSNFFRGGRGGGFGGGFGGGHGGGFGGGFGGGHR